MVVSKWKKYVHQQDIKTINHYALDIRISGNEVKAVTTTERNSKATTAKDYNTLCNRSWNKEREK